MLSNKVVELQELLSQAPGFGGMSLKAAFPGTSPQLRPQRGAVCRTRACAGSSFAENPAHRPARR